MSKSNQLLFQWHILPQMTVKVDGVKQVSQKNVFVNGDVQRQGH